MPLQIVRNDITMMACDAIVNAANPQLAGGGGVDGAIHRAAGPDLHEACMKLGGCQTGQAKLTKGFDLPCKYIIHTVGPVWVDGTQGEKELLESCYRESLLLAKKKRCKTVAFPLISAGVYGYPKDQALRVAVNTISEFLLEHDMQVILVVYDKTCFQISKQLVTDIEEYIDECYIKEHYQGRREFIDRAGQSVYNMPPQSAPQRMAPQMQEEAKGLFQGRFAKRELQIMLGQIDESFSQMLLRKIDEKGMTDAQCYKKANIDRKLFSKIRKDVQYKPSKTTAIAFAIALELSLAETVDLLMKAGFALSHSNKFDIIIEYFIRNGNYNIFEINEALFAFDQNLLGA